MRQFARLAMAAFLSATLSGCIAEIVPRSGPAATDGSSTQAAIPVSSVDAEYQWLAANRPGWQPVRQKLLGGPRGKTYDVITIVRADQITDIYFDVSSFFGKPG